MQISMDKKYRTRGGMPVRILCVDLRSNRPVCAALKGRSDSDSEIAMEFYADGRVSTYGDDHLDLVEVSPYDDFKRDEPVMVSSTADGRWFPRYFSHVEDGTAYCYIGGATSWSATRDNFSGLADVCAWTECRRPTPEELVDKSV